MSTIKADTLSNVAGSRSIPVDRVAQGVAAAWVNFNGTGTVAIRAAYNVSSITDNGTGDYTVNFTAALADANFAAVCSSHETTGNYSSTAASVVNATASARVKTFKSYTNVANDTDITHVAIFR